MTSACNAVVAANYRARVPFAVPCLSKRSKSNFRVVCAELHRVKSIGLLHQHDQCNKVIQFLLHHKLNVSQWKIHWPTRNWSWDLPLNSQMLYQLSYRVRCGRTLNLLSISSISCLLSKLITKSCYLFKRYHLDLRVYLSQCKAAMLQESATQERHRYAYRSNVTLDISVYMSILKVWGLMLRET